MCICSARTSQLTRARAFCSSAHNECAQASNCRSDWRPYVPAHPFPFIWPWLTDGSGLWELLFPEADHHGPQIRLFLRKCTLPPGGKCESAC